MTAYHTHTLTISAGETHSTVLDMSSAKLLGVLLPSSFQGTRLRVAAAVAPDGTFYPVSSDDAVITATGKAGQWVVFNEYPGVFAMPCIKLWFDDGSGNAVTQTSTITLVVCAK